ncbi:uncharacterized protein CMC5_013490 [Chondromyces crocatus]|uniref:C-type lectin domain-containing protein n=2 Tax=Chondromyces crocatus TaxID=52 RepID=A0A0K1E9G8_CHOCO|nr:uncharacterized protein CMC5_013490 [Chondromyces crocatus]
MRWFAAAGALLGACVQGTDDGSGGGEPSGSAAGPVSTSSAGVGGAGGTGGGDEEPSCTPSTWYLDEDGDGFGVESTATVTCPQPPGHVALAGDCDDTRAGVKPGAIELCNGIDDDCDEVVDEGACSAGCTGTVNPANGHSYTFCSSANWANASARCADLGMRLVRVDDVDENTWLRTQMLSRGFGQIWLGASDAVTEQTWLWQDGDPFWQGGPNGMPVGNRYSAWTNGEPNDDGTEDCAAMRSDGRWHDTECGGGRPIACELY